MESTICSMCSIEKNVEDFYKKKNVNFVIAEEA